MLFGGTSAGGFGTLYNYHYVLDDLQWAHTAAWPDASLALDNGETSYCDTAGVTAIPGVNALPLPDRLGTPRKIERSTRVYAEGFILRRR